MSALQEEESKSSSSVGQGHERSLTGHESYSVQPNGSYVDSVTALNATNLDDISVHSHETNGGDLLRSVTQYTEFSAQHGNSSAPVEPKKQHAFFSKENTAVRRNFYKVYGVILLALSVFVLTVFSIYWGSMYDRSSRLQNLKVLVVVEDQDSNGNYPFLSDAIVQTSQSATIKPLLGWEIYNRSTIAQWTIDRSEDHGLSINDEITRRIHRQTYWSSIYVQSNNVSQQLLDAIQSGDSSFNTSNLINVYYETGRDFSTMSSYVTPFVKDLEKAYLEYLGTVTYPNHIVGNLTSAQFDHIRTSSPGLLSTLPVFSYRDGAVYSNAILLAPLQIGIIYLIILTFFQFMWFMQLHGGMAPHLKPLHYLFYRIICSQIAFLTLSLIYSAVNAAFQINFNKSWKGGFGVEWMISYLTMSAVGGANENIALLCMCTLPPLMGFWMLFWVVINIAPTFSPLALTSRFYRYGYAFPIHNANEAMKVLLFDTWRGQLGRNIGILVVWSVLNIAFMPFCLMFFANTMKKKAQKAALAAQKAEEEKSKQLASASTTEHSSTEKDSSDSV